MQKILIIIAGVVVVGGGVWYVTSQPSADQATSETGEAMDESNSETMEIDSANNSGFGALSSMMGLGKSVRCEFSSNVEGENAKGEFFTDGERFRVDSTYTSNEGTIISKMIDDGEFVYIWGTSPQGEMAFKTPHQEPVVGDDDGMTVETGQESYFDVDQQVEYDCDNWRVDRSLFVAPSDINFTDMEAIMREAMQGMPEGFEMPAGY